MMTACGEHHILTILQICSACLDLVATQPKTDVNLEINKLLEYQFDIIDCLVTGRHFGSDHLDAVIRDCHNLMAHIEEMKNE